MLSLKRSIVGKPVQFYRSIQIPQSNIHWKAPAVRGITPYCTRISFKSQLSGICYGKLTTVSVIVLLITTYGTGTLSSPIYNVKEKNQVNWSFLKSSGFSTRSDTNQAVQPQKLDRSLKSLIKKVEGLYYPSSENKGADQLRGYREADLRLCFCICKNPVFSGQGSYVPCRARVHARG